MVPKYGVEAVPRYPDAHRLKPLNSFRSNRNFRTLRPDVFGNGAGLQAGVYEAALGREVAGGSGILLDYNLARFFAD